MKIGFIGLGNVGRKLSGSLLRNGMDLSVHDLNAKFVADFVSRGATDNVSPKNLMQTCDAVITCLPSPAASDAVVTEMLPTWPFVKFGWKCRPLTPMRLNVLEA